LKLVAVIPILGILATVAASKSFNISASDNSLKQTLSAVRNAINTCGSSRRSADPDSFDGDLSGTAV